jgi:hypothetical protein
MLQYYGVEQTNRKQCEELKGTPGEPIPLYQKGAYRYTLKDGEDEAKVRDEIEKRCRSYAEVYPEWLPPEFRMSFSVVKRWLRLYQLDCGKFGTLPRLIYFLRLQQLAAKANKCGYRARR